MQSNKCFYTVKKSALIINEGHYLTNRKVYMAYGIYNEKFLTEGGLGSCIMHNSQRNNSKLGSRNERRKQEVELINQWVEFCRCRCHPRLNKGNGIRKHGHGVTPSYAVTKDIQKHDKSQILN